MNRLLAINTKSDILTAYKNTPIEELIEFHNLNGTFKTFDKANLLIGMCMDNRNKLEFPDNFAYVIRTAGSNLSHCDFMISYALSVGQIEYMAVVGHNDCGMVNLENRKHLFVSGMQQFAGWDEKSATKHFELLAPKHEIHNSIDFTLHQVNQLRNKYPKIVVAPFLFKVEDRKLYFIEEV